MIHKRLRSLNIKTYYCVWSAVASHYDQEAEYYDAFDESRSALINQVIESILHSHGIESVLDLTCGTDSQIFWLAQYDYEVFGVDINCKMLKIAQHKAEQQKLSFRLEQGDMRTAEIGRFDAVLTIFSSIGHLTKEDFELALQNVNSNLKPGGIYIFDIFNLDYLLHDDNITKLTIDWQKKSGEAIARKFSIALFRQRVCWHPTIFIMSKLDRISLRLPMLFKHFKFIMQHSLEMCWTEMVLRP